MSDDVRLVATEAAGSLRAVVAAVDAVELAATMCSGLTGIDGTGLRRLLESRGMSP
jgi:hypothetical protein